jgi:PAS domain S-box-containing protein
VLAEVTASEVQRDTLDAEAFRQLVEGVSESVALTDVEGRILWVNAAFCALLECSASELVERPLEDLLPPEEMLKLVGFVSYLDGKDLLRDLNVFFAGPNGTRASVVASIARVRRGRESDRFVLVGRSVGAREEELAQTTRWAAAEQDRANELARARDELARTLGELQETQTALIEASRQASRANEELHRKVVQLERMEQELRLSQKLEAVGRLSAGVAHEINTPVQFIGDSIHFLREAYDEVRQEVQRLTTPTGAVDLSSGADLVYLDKEVPSAFAHVAIGVDRISKIVHAMKTFARNSYGERSHLDMNGAVETTIEIARGELRHVADVELHLGELPPVDCEGDQINQALLNVIVNAAHAIQDAVGKSDRRGKLTVSTRAENDSVVISVGDTGTGIPDHVKDRIFDLFFTTKEVGRGTGQGLALVWAVIVDKHGGQVWVDTELGVGSTFHIKLPTNGSPHRGA